MSGKCARLPTGVLPQRLTVATGADGVHRLSAVPVEPTATKLWRWWWLTCLVLAGPAVPSARLTVAASQAGPGVGI
jgi:hypothetical protein